MTEEAKTIGKRIRTVRGGISQGEFAKIIGTHPVTISKYERDQMAPAYDVLLKIIERFNLSAQWLISGEGPMLVGDTSVPMVVSGDSDPDLEMVSHLDIEASAGGGSLVDNEFVKGKIAFVRKWLRHVGLDPKQLNVISVKGDSMEPSLSDGDIILIDRRDTDPRSGGVYVLNLDGSLLVKRLQRLLNGDIEVSSDNPRYRTEVVPVSQLELVRIIGRVVWSGGLMS